MMKWGYSQHWSKTLEEFTGDGKYNTSALLAYFKPLDDYLTEYLNNNSITPGWDNGTCPDAPDFYLPPEPNVTTTYIPTTATPPTSTTTPTTTTITTTPTTTTSAATTKSTVLYLRLCVCVC